MLKGVQREQSLELLGGYIVLLNITLPSKKDRLYWIIIKLFLIRLCVKTHIVN